MQHKHDHHDDPLKDATRGVRLQKVMAEAGVGSRRRCEELVIAGAVEVNGRIVTELPAWVDAATDRVVVEGRLLPNTERKIYVMLYKPRGVVSTVDDPAGRRTVVELVEHPSGARLYPVGRLDFDTSGLLLLTNDGELANRLTHPRYGLHKTYRATVKGRLEPEEIESLERGVYLAQRRTGRAISAKRTANVQIAIVARDRDRTTLELVLAEGRNRQVRRMLSHVGHPVRKLIRIAVGPIQLKGLRVGEWRELTRQELRTLRRAAKGDHTQGGQDHPRARPR